MKHLCRVLLALSLTAMIFCASIPAAWADPYDLANRVSLEGFAYDVPASWSATETLDGAVWGHLYASRTTGGPPYFYVFAYKMDTANYQESLEPGYLQDAVKTIGDQAGLIGFEYIRPTSVAGCNAVRGVVVYDEGGNTYRGCFLFMIYRRVMLWATYIDLEDGDRKEQDAMMDTFVASISVGEGDALSAPAPKATPPKATATPRTYATPKATATPRSYATPRATSTPGAYATPKTTSAAKPYATLSALLTPRPYVTPKSTSTPKTSAVQSAGTDWRQLYAPGDDGAYHVSGGNDALRGTKVRVEGDLIDKDIRSGVCEWTVRQSNGRTWSVIMDPQVDVGLETGTDLACYGIYMGQSANGPTLNLLRYDAAFIAFFDGQDITGQYEGRSFEDIHRQLTE